MKVSGRCPKCDSTDIIADAMVIDRFRASLGETHLTIATFQNPGALIFRGRRTMEASAWVCGQCGFIELYARKPQQLKQPRPKS